MPTSKSIVANVVRVEFIETAKIAPRGWEALGSYLPEDEHARAARFHFERDRQVYVAGHALMRDMLAREAGKDPRDWSFAIGPHGRPEPVCDPGAPKLRINLSHTRGLAAVALTCDADVGIDVEWMNRGADLLKIAERFFAPDEQRQLEEAPEDRRRDMFFAFWTLKESYIKATGLGLTMPLDAFAFTLADLAITFAPQVADDSREWHFRHQHVLDAHALSVAVRRQGGYTPDVTIAPADLDRLLGR